MEGAAPTIKDGQAQPASVNQLGVKLPAFWPAKPLVWFAQVEAQFTLANIRRSETKYNHVVAALDSRYAAEVEDILIDPPETDRYETLKKELVRRLTVSEERRIHQLLYQEEIGDRSPSQFLRRMRSLAEGAIQESILRSLWIKRLPEHVQGILQAQSAPLNELAELADRIVEPAQPRSCVNEASRARDAQAQDITSEILNRIEELSLRVNEIGRGRNTWRPRGRSRSQSRGRPNQSQTTWCWYHDIYKERAKRCSSPCTFPKNGGSSP
jgi:hypothetical protein